MGKYLISVVLCTGALEFKRFGDIAPFTSEEQHVSYLELIICEDMSFDLSHSS